MSRVISTEFANSFYNCYLFGKSVKKVTKSRVSSFADFADLYTSFLFNMLSQSLSIKVIADNLQTDWQAQKYPEFLGQLATLIRIMLDFESSTSSSFGEDTVQ